jgi:hypothetical protein
VAHDDDDTGGFWLFAFAFFGLPCFVRFRLVGWLDCWSPRQSWVGMQGELLRFSSEKFFAFRREARPAL